LKDHADPPPEGHDVHAVGVDVGAIEGHRPADPRPRDQIVHAIEGAEKRRLAAPRRTDAGGYLMSLDIKGDVGERLLVTVEEVESSRRNFRHRANGGRLIE
jgi:hypothetical protein